MNWHDYPPHWKELSHLVGIKEKTPQECLKLLRRRLGDDKAMWNTHVQLYGEVEWQKNRRPYYDLYPGIAQAFSKIDLGKVMCHHLSLPLPQLLIRLPVGYEMHGGTHDIKSILVIETESGEHNCPGWLLSINDGHIFEGYIVHSVCGFSLIPNSSVAERLTYGREHPYCIDDIDNEEVDMAVRVVVAICLLKDDINLIEPLPLANDMEKWEKSHDQSLIDKAERRGKRAWAVGKRIELSPTFRRPHFAIRWCGPGGTDPRLRPVKGCIVLREKAQKFPTGYLAEEKNENDN